jgi:hypothetical protein
VALALLLLSDVPPTRWLIQFIEFWQSHRKALRDLNDWRRDDDWGAFRPPRPDAG